MQARIAKLPAAKASRTSRSCFHALLVAAADMLFEETDQAPGQPVQIAGKRPRGEPGVSTAVRKIQGHAGRDFPAPAGSVRAEMGHCAHARSVSALLCRRDRACCSRASSNRRCPGSRAMAPSRRLSNSRNVRAFRTMSAVIQNRESAAVSRGSCFFSRLQEMMAIQRDSRRCSVGLRPSSGRPAPKRPPPHRYDACGFACSRPSHFSSALPPSDTPAANNGVPGLSARRRCSIQSISPASPEWYARGNRFGSPLQPRKWTTTPRQWLRPTARISAVA